MKRPLLVFVLIIAALAAACQSTSPPLAENPTISPPPPSPTVTPAPATEVTPAPVELTPTEKPPIQATLDALRAAVTVSPATPSADDSTKIIAADDYVGMFEQAWRIVRDNYVRDNFNGVDWNAIHDLYLPQAEAVADADSFWDMMEDFIGELGDDHSRFVRPDRFGAEFDIELSHPASSDKLWTAMTIWPAREDEKLLIWYVCDVGPASSAGLQRGDVILAINGKPVERGPNGFEREDYIDAVVGNGSVTLTVQRGPDNDPEDVTLRYDGGSGCDGWSYGLISEEPRVGYLRIPDFGGGVEEQVLDLIELMEEEAPLDGLIIDVRHNPGGNSDRTIALFTTGVFGKQGPLRADSSQSIYRIRGPVRWNETTPVALLIDGASHSAAEYFATAMQQSGRAVLVGQPTAGNTEGINSFGLPDGSVIRLAWTTLQLPDGGTLEGVGVIPDILVPLGDWGLRQDPDVQLQAAFEAVLDLITAQN